MGRHNRPRKPRSGSNSQHAATQELNIRIVNPTAYCESPAALGRDDGACLGHVFKREKGFVENVLSYKARKAKNQRRYYQKYVPIDPSLCNYLFTQWFY
jgi:hypothetical protein